jgi:cytoskeletal protein CcmA (bactofilin family)
MSAKEKSGCKAEGELMGFFKDNKNTSSLGMSNVETTGQEIRHEAFPTRDTYVKEEEPEKDNETLNNIKESEMGRYDDELEDSADETAVITAGLTVTGNLDSTGSIDVFGTVEGDVSCMGKLTVSGTIHGSVGANEVYANDAHIKGNIRATGSLKIGEGTVIIGDLSGTSAVIAGAVKGNIDIEGPIIIDSTAVIRGDIKFKNVQINNGASIDGRCSQCYIDVDEDDIFDIEQKEETEKSDSVRGDDDKINVAELSDDEKEAVMAVAYGNNTTQEL